jgi:hypothetical protein
VNEKEARKTTQPLNLAVLTGRNNLSFKLFRGCSFDVLELAARIGFGSGSGFGF